MNPIPATQPVNVQPAASAQAIIAPEPTDRWTALRQVGFWKGSDFVILGYVILHLFVLASWSIFGKPTSFQVLGMVLFMSLALQVWAVILAFRCMDFVLQARARLEMMPFDAARMAVGYMRGGQPLQ